jgi:hypothetical protein
MLNKYKKHHVTKNKSASEFGNPVTTPEIGMAANVLTQAFFCCMFKSWQIIFISVGMNYLLLSSMSSIQRYCKTD